MDKYDGSYYGFPIVSQDDSEPDCRRTSWSVLVDGEWHEIICCALDWREKDAADGLIKALVKGRERSKALVIQALIEAQTVAGNEPNNEAIRKITSLLKEAINYGKEGEQCLQK